MSPQLDHIWQQIQRLDEAERLSLGMCLHELTEAQRRQQPDANGDQGATGWRALYGAADRSEVAELQRIIDAEFSTINPEGWD